jgi:colicin import membrane protein
MTRNPKYPLAPLREHRDRTVDAATAELGEAVRAREAADLAKRVAEREREEAAARAEAVRREEADRLGRGELRAADLARAQAWEHGARVESSELTQAVERAAEHVEARRDAEGSAREALGQKKAELDVVVKDQARFDDQARRARDVAEEEAAEEVFTAALNAKKRRDG